MFETWISLVHISFYGVVALIGFDDCDTGINDTVFGSVSAFAVASVPVPAAAPLLIAGLVGLGFTGRRVRP